MDKAAFSPSGVEGRGGEALAALAERFPTVPPSLILKTDLLRRGVRYSDDLVRAGRWALPQIHFIFEWDHKDVHRAEDVAEGWITVPQTLCLPDGTNVLVKLDPESPYEVAYEGDGRYGLRRDGERVERVFFVPRPRWFTRRTRDGALMCRVAGGNGECVFSVLNLSYCEYFGGSQQCVFCTIVPTQDRNRELGMGKLSSRDLDRITETFDTAAEEGNIQHFCLSGGALFDRGREAAYFAQLVETLRGASAYQGQPFLIASQALEPPDARRIWEAGEGTVTISYPMEVWDERLFPIVCPGKAEKVGRSRWLDNLQAAVDIFGRGNVGTNIVAGVEVSGPEGLGAPEAGIASTLAGFEWLCRHDVRPSFSPWTVAPGSAWSDRTPPPTDYYLELGLGLFELQERFGLPFRAGIDAGCYKCACYTVTRDYERLMVPGMMEQPAPVAGAPA